VLEYTGTLTYTPGANPVSGSVNLTNAVDQLLGPVNFVKSVADPHHHLTLQGAWLTNAAQHVLTLYQSSSFSRDLTPLTNYYGGVAFNDGELTTAAADYDNWELSIDDLSMTPIRTGFRTSATNPRRSRSAGPCFPWPAAQPMSS